MKELALQYSTIILFLHVFSGVIWVGGMIAIRVAVHPVMQSIEDPAIKLGKTLEIVGRLFHLVIPFIIFLILTALIFEIYWEYSGILIRIKEGIWSIMTLNFIYMYLRRYKAWKLFQAGKLKEAKELAKPLPNLLLPINIFLGVVAIFLGVILRGF